VPKPIESLRGVKVDAVAAGNHHTLALADDGSVYIWGREAEEDWDALDLGLAGGDPEERASMPQRIPGLRVACGL
jgi:regulator of chromosome condensation